MLVKVAILFLAVMVALSLFGVLRKPRKGPCPKCGRHKVGGTCGCRK